MKHMELENELKTRIRNRRIVEAVLSVVFLVIAVTFTALRDESKVVEEIGLGIVSYQSVTYNNDYLWGILVGVLGLIPSVLFLLADLLCSKVVTFKVNRDYITFYRGLVHTKLYVNGAEKGSIAYGYYFEAPLSDGTKVTVMRGKWSAHCVFSNGHPPIDV